ncbi:hypothetical protein FB567DRAFT_195849 [Paraphoma chrysanthemicola]|uniref:Uncharacterized protein n=1 Tax=Paraphoma chrysanthemicola TaxID=798071 RepID=A0A8K0VT59_9PLEO|nr:hypothetical protein FB567DRAFT_195849 [Paraphoma chrysanthemicola]
MGCSGSHRQNLVPCITCACTGTCPPTSAQNPSSQPSVFQQNTTEQRLNRKKKQTARLSRHPQPLKPQHSLGIRALALHLAPTTPWETVIVVVALLPTVTTSTLFFSFRNPSSPMRISCDRCGVCACRLPAPNPDKTPVRTLHIAFISESGFKCPQAKARQSRRSTPFYPFVSAFCTLGAADNTALQWNPGRQPCSALRLH